MNYKVVRNNGHVVAFGPNDDNYEPALKQGETLTIEEMQPTIPLRRSDYIAKVRAKAQEVRAGGTTINGIKVRADDNAIARITGAQVNPRAERKVVTGAGSRVILTQTQFDSFAASAEAFSQAVMDKEYDSLELIAATSDAGLPALDLDSGWPA